MAKRIGCPTGTRLIKGKCVDTSYLKDKYAGKLSLTEDESDVLFSNLYDLTKGGVAKVERFPQGDPITTGFHLGKTELQILKQVKKKVDKIRP